MRDLPRIAPPIHLTNTQRQELQRVVRASSSSAAETRWVRIILLAGDGHPSDEIAATLQIFEPMVFKWRGRFAQHGMSGLADVKRSGRPINLPPEKFNAVLSEVTRPPKNRSRWSVRAMARHADISKSRVQ